MILIRLPIVKTLNYYISDSESRKLEERKGLDTLVVLAVNDAD